jgi:DNA-binding transcriptional MerR regulator
MKNWITIGQFSKKVGLSAKALRLYEGMGLIKSHVRGENQYRYYNTEQVSLALKIKKFKNLGFSLAEIKTLLEIKENLNPDAISNAMKTRLELIQLQSQKLSSQKNQIIAILASLKKSTMPLKATQRRAIMSLYGKVFIIVTGHSGLQKTADSIKLHLDQSGEKIQIFKWTENFQVPEQKPFVLIIEEWNLKSERIKILSPDVIVINNLSEHSIHLQNNYLKLFNHIGPHVNTIINADDRAAVDFAGHSQIKKGRIFYFTKNKALLPQIKKIGGVVCSGDEIQIFGFNLKKQILKFKIKQILSLSQELGLISSLAAVLTLGLKKEDLKLS